MSGSVSTIKAPDSVLNAQMLATLGKLFAGSNTKTSQSQTIKSDDTSTAALLDALKVAQGNSTDPKITEDLVNNILQKAAISFGPTQAQEHVAGLYGSTTMQQLSQQAQADATAAASKSVLDYKTAQQQIALNAAGTLANNNKSISTNGTQKEAAVIPSSLSGGLGLLTAASLGYKMLGAGGDKSSGLLGDTFAGLKKLVVGDSALAGPAILPEGTSVADFISNTSMVPHDAITSVADATGGAGSLIAAPSSWASDSGTSLIASEVPALNTAALTAGGATDASTNYFSVDGGEQSTFSSVGDGISDAASAVKDTVSGWLDDAGSFISDLFDW